MTSLRSLLVTFSAVLLTTGLISSPLTPIQEPVPLTDDERRPAFFNSRELRRLHLVDLENALTAADSGDATEIARAFTRRFAPGVNLRDADLDDLMLVRRYTTAHNGVTHLSFRQRFRGIEVANTEWVVNVDRDGRVLNAAGTLVRGPGDSTGSPASRPTTVALRQAVSSVNPRVADGFEPVASPSRVEDGKTVRFEAQGLGDDVESEPVWFASGDGVYPAWRFHIVDSDGIGSYRVLVDAEGGRVLEKESQTFYQTAAQGLVFERGTPQPLSTPGLRVTADPAFVQRTSRPFLGNGIASPLGWVMGRSTVGNNTTTGQNLFGTRFLTAPATAHAADANFAFPLQLGRGVAPPTQFGNAATTNLFYWVNLSHDLFYEAGFDEAAGNYQSNNFGKGGVDGDALLAYSHFGAARSITADLNNAFYTTRRTGQDGAQSMIAMFLVSLGRDFLSDGSYDASVIVHEYAHGVSTRIVRQLSGFHGGSLGEAWSDYFGLEFTIPDGAPAEGSYAVGEYWSQAFNRGIRTRPYSSDAKVNPLTFASLGHVVSFPEIHADGEIWVQALMEIRTAMIQRYGDKEGRRRTRLLVMDGMKLSPPAPTMVDARDAILLADRVDFAGAHQDLLWAAFARRGFGVLAHSPTTNSLHVKASTETPSPRARLSFYESRYVIGETIRLLIQDGNNPLQLARVEFRSSSGDVENLNLPRTGSIFYAAVPSSGVVPIRQNGTLELTPGDTITAVHLDADNGGRPELREITAEVTVGYSGLVGNPRPLDFANETPLGFRTSSAAIGTPVSLPFEFPFFDGKYSTVYLHADGLLTFDTPNIYACQDNASLRFLKSIAPLWMESRTNGFSQTGQDVYLSRTDDSVTFRWRGETVPLSLFGMPEPTNFSATLFRNGRIEFRYGAGNRNLTSAPPFGPCGASVPTVGVSNGKETLSQLVGSHHGRTSLENAQSIVIDPPFGATSSPEGIVESPQADELVAGVLTGRGIVFDRESQVTRMDVLVDGITVGRATTLESRADFCGSNNVPGCPRVGFRFAVDLRSAGVTSGPHRLSFRATNAAGAVTAFPESPIPFRLDAAAGPVVQAGIDAPVAGQTISGRFTVRGFALASTVRIARVEVLVDGLTLGPAGYGVRSDALCAGSTSPNCPNAGFNFTLDTQASTPRLPNGTHTLMLRITDEVGRTTMYPEGGLSFSVDNPVNRLPVGAITAPVNNQTLSGITRITGWAYDPDGQVVQVRLVIDGQVRAVATLGQARPEVCAALTGVSACPNIGFEMDFDTRRLSNGAHVLGMQLIDNSGQFVVIPDLNRFGMNVIVQNN